jgi:(2Fe-2S) ferredoxin
MAADERVLRLVTCCQGCGAEGFLAWDDGVGVARRALCIDCHERAGTGQAGCGGCCQDGCGLVVEHAGLCWPEPVDVSVAAPVVGAWLPGV